MEAGEDCESDSPQRKKMCEKINTPEKLKSPVTCQFERCVKVSNLPPMPKFMEISFCKHVEKVRRKEGIAPEKTKAIIKAYNYSKADSFVFLEFDEADIADRMCRITVVYLKHKLHFEAAVNGNDNQTAVENVSETPLDSSNLFTQQMRQLSPFEVKRNLFDQDPKDDYNMDLVENLEEFIPVANSTALEFEHEAYDFNRTTADKIDKSCKVLVGNLPTKLFKDHFLEFINDELRAMLGLFEEECAALSVSDPIAGSTIVVFRTVEEAQAACFINTPYGKYNLEFKQLPKEYEMSCKVQVRNLPKKLFKDHFLEFINDELRERLGLSAEENAALSVSDLIAGSTIVVFRTVEEAQAACFINTPYGKYNLEFKQLEECEVSRTEDLSDNGAIEVSITPINEAQEGETLNLNRNTIKLKSNEGDLIFLRALVQFRRLFLDRNNHSSGYARVLCAIELEGISASIPEITARRKYFLDMYNKKKKLQTNDYFHSKALLVIFGDAPIEMLNGTEYSPTSTEIISLTDPSKVAETAAIFSKGAVFNEPASLKLISIVRANLDVYPK